MSSIFIWCQDLWHTGFKAAYCEPSIISQGGWSYSNREGKRQKTWLAGTAANAVGCSIVPRTYYSYYYFHLLKWFNFISSIIRLTDYPVPQHRDTGFKQVCALMPQRGCWERKSKGKEEQGRQRLREQTRNGMINTDNVKDNEELMLHSLSHRKNVIQLMGIAI